MIKLVRAFEDSQGVMHPTREGACKAEFRRLLAQKWMTTRKGGSEQSLEFEAWPLVAPNAIPVDDLVEAMFEIDKMIGEATKEDTRVEYAPAADV